MSTPERMRRQMEDSAYDPHQMQQIHSSINKGEEVENINYQVASSKDRLCDALGIESPIKRSYAMEQFSPSKKVRF